MRKILCLLLMIVVLFSFSYAAEEEEIYFTDVDSSYWGYTAIMQMVEDGVVNGYEDHTFKPNKEITRAEFAKMFSISMGVDYDRENIGFDLMIDDVEESNWAYSYIKSTFGYLPRLNYDGNVFEANSYVTREDAAYAFATRINPYPIIAGAIDRFEDVSEVAPEKIERVNQAVSSGIINGYGDGTLNPKGALTRAQVCTLIYNIKYQLKIDKDYLKFKDIYEYIYHISQSGDNGNERVTVQFAFKVDGIEDADVLVTDENGNYMDANVTLGVSRFNYPMVEVVFETQNPYGCHVWLSGLKTSDGRETYGNSAILFQISRR